LVAIRSVVIVDECVTERSAAGGNGIIVVTSNPVDLTMIAFRCAGLPREPDHRHFPCPPQARPANVHTGTEPKAVIR
jgi:hypothetical protein